MKICKVKYSMGATINLGNYENIKTSLEIEAEIEERDSIEAVIEELKSLARNQIRADYKKYRRGKRDSYDC